MRKTVNKQPFESEVKFQWGQKTIDGETIYIPMPPKPKVSGHTFRKNKERFVRIGEYYILITLYKVVKQPKYIVIITKYTNLTMHVGQMERTFKDVLINYWSKYQTISGNDSNFTFVQNLLKVDYEFDMYDKQMRDFFKNATQIPEHGNAQTIMKGLTKAGYGKGMKLESYMHSDCTICDSSWIQETHKYQATITCLQGVKTVSEYSIASYLNTNIDEGKFFANTILYEKADKDKILCAGTMVWIRTEGSSVGFGVKSSEDIYVGTTIKVTTAIHVMITPITCEGSERKLVMFELEGISDDLIYSILKCGIN